MKVICAQPSKWRLSRMPDCLLEEGLGCRTLRVLLSMKSTVCPHLSTARYRRILRTGSANIDSLRRQAIALGILSTEAVLPNCSLFSRGKESPFCEAILARISLSHSEVLEL
jgi:hypothetical protein